MGHLKPGESIEVEERDAASDSVRVKGKGDQRITIGTRAASKLLVQIARAIATVLALTTNARAQTTVADRSRPFEITDNSFFVEEAFNQEPGVFQNIFGVLVDEHGEWQAAFTQEWPLFSQTHQFSYTVPYAAIGDASGVGDVRLNYRLQVLLEHGSTPAFSPRLSLILPTGNASDGLGQGHPGWQVNLPFSKQSGDMYFHWNAGFTHLPRAEIAGVETDVFTPNVAASGIWRLKPMLHLMLEGVLEWQEAEDRTAVGTISPGFRTGWNSRDAQTIFGFALPISTGGGSTSVGVFGYFSYELPFLTPP